MLIAAFDQDRNLDVAVGEIPVAPAVAAIDGRTDAGDLVDRRYHVGLPEVGSEQIALGVDIGRDMMSDAGVIMAKADAAIEGGGPKPNRAALLAMFQNAPETDVAALVGALAGRLLEGEVLPPVAVIQMAYRRLSLRTVEQNAADNLDARAQRDRIGWMPARGIHRAQHVLARSDQADIDRIAGNAGRCARDHGEAGEILLVLVAPPEQRQHDIGDQKIEADDRGGGRDQRGSPFDVVGANLHRG